MDENEVDPLIGAKIRFGDGPEYILKDYWTDEDGYTNFLTECDKLFTAKGLYPTSIKYDLGVDQADGDLITLVGNNKAWGEIDEKSKRID